MKIDQNDFAQQISRAEKSVVNVKEERLREIAFGKVLDHLLNASTSVLDQSETRTNPFSRSKLKVEKKNKFSGPRAWLNELVQENFFLQPKSMKEMLTELKCRSHHLKAPDLTLSLQNLCEEKKLRRLPKIKGKRLQWVNW